MKTLALLLLYSAAGSGQVWWTHLSSARGELPVPPATMEPTASLVVDLDKDGDEDIDASGELPGGIQFKGAAELKKILKQKQEQVARGMAEKLLIYSLGRGLEYYDKRPLDTIVSQTAKGEYKFSALVTAIVQSDPFRKRRGTLD